MHITFLTYLICCPLVFLAGLVDAIGGGGGLISLPAYLLAGLGALGNGSAGNIRRYFRCNRCGTPFH